MQADNATLELCLDKMAFSEWCIASGLPCPMAWIPGRGLRPTSLRFPVLLRPVRTLHGHRELGLPFSNVKELIAYAKANPGKVAIGNSEAATMLTGELFKMMAGVELQQVPYKGGAPLMTDVVGGF